MPEKPRKKYFYVSIFLVIAIIGFLGILSFNLSRNLSRTANELEKTSQLNDVLKKKYLEEKTRASAFQKGKLIADARAREMEDRAAAAEIRVEEVRTQKNEALKQLQGQIDLFNTKIDQYTKALDEFKAQNKILAQSEKQLTSNLKQKERELAKKETAIEEMQSHLDHTTSEIARITGQNQRLSELSQELLVSFDKKGFFRSMLEKEPFTQVKRVELEKMIGEYLDAIERATVLESESTY